MAMQNSHHFQLGCHVHHQCLHNIELAQFLSFLWCKLTCFTNTILNQTIIPDSLSGERFVENSILLAIGVFFCLHQLLSALYFDVHKHTCMNFHI